MSRIVPRGRGTVHVHGGRSRLPKGVALAQPAPRSRWSGVTSARIAWIRGLPHPASDSRHTPTPTSGTASRLHARIAVRAPREDGQRPRWMGRSTYLYAA